MKFSLVHPSRNRAVKAFNTFSDWMMNASGEHHYEYIVSIDDTDSQAQEYRNRFDKMATVIQNQNRSLVDAVNRGAEMSTGDCIIVVSDDFDSPKNWDRDLDDFITTSIESDQYAIHVNDDYSYPKELLTIPILSQQLFRRLGYIYHPSYFSMYADNDIFEACKLIGVLHDCGHLTFRHNHYTVNRSPNDMTYIRQNSQQAYQLGQSTIIQRRARKFDLIPTT